MERERGKMWMGAGKRATRFEEKKEERSSGMSDTEVARLRRVRRVEGVVERGPRAGANEPRKI